MTKDEILHILSDVKPKYEEEGLILLGLFGSFAREAQKVSSDIDIAYRIDYERFSDKYRDGFSKILRIEEIRGELEKRLGKRVDLVSDSNKKVTAGMISV